MTPTATQPARPVVDSPAKLDVETGFASSTARGDVTSGTGRARHPPAGCVAAFQGVPLLAMAVPGQRRNSRPGREQPTEWTVTATDRRTRSPKPLGRCPATEGEK